jgi:hypothetical protein
MCVAAFSESPIFRYMRVTVVPSWHCDADCRHCYLPGDFRKRDNYDPQVMESVLSGMPESIRVIGFTGGEPFLHLGRLFRLFKMVSQTGRVSTVITNALWARDTRRADDLLAQAYECGLRGLSVSLDDYHRPAVSVATVNRLLRSARRMGMVVSVQGVGVEARRKIDRVEASGVLSGHGSAVGHVNLENVGTAASIRTRDVPSRDNGTCLSAMDPVVTPQGIFLTCCSPRLLQVRNPVLVRGGVEKEPIGVIVDRALRDYLLAAVVVMGPAGLLRLLGKRLPSRPVTRCELCLGILEDSGAVLRLRRRIETDLDLRKEIVGRHMVLEKCYLPEVPPELQGA